MEHFFNKAAVVALAACATFSLTACDGDDPAPGSEVSERETMMKAIAQQLVTGVVNPTYKQMADNTDALYDAISEMREAAKTKSVKQSQVDKACELFKAARKGYENSEAFLLGAAAKFNVDPHIDSWPLDVNAVKTLLLSPKMISDLDSDDGDAIAYASLGQSTLGFHGLEFILFRDGQPRKAEELNGTDSWEGLESITGEQELVYAKAVSGDLRNNCYILEIGWNDNSNSAHKDKLDELEWQYTTNGEISFGEDFVTAGNPGSSYKTVKAAIAAILIGDMGARGICDEVGDTKIGKPHTGQTEEDISYIESPYSYNSITDFHDNIVSIENVWKGSTNGSASANSLSAYFAKYHKEIGQQVEDAIAKAKAEIKKMPVPFVKHYRDKQCGVVMEACGELSAKLEEANRALQND